MEDLIKELPTDLLEKGLSAYEKALLKGENRIKGQMEKYKIELEAQAQAKVDKALKRIKVTLEKAHKKAEAEKAVALEKARKKAEAEKAALEKAHKKAEEQNRKTIVNLLKSGALSEEQIASIMSISIDYVIEIKKKL